MKSLYSDLNRNGNRSSMDGLVAQFEKFRQSFQGDPKAEVERLLQSGRMTQQDLDKLQAMASEFQRLIK